MATKKFTYGALACALACAPLVASADDPAPTAHAPAATASLSHDELQILAHLHHVNQQEIRAGQLAVHEGADPSVRDYGRMLVRDHGKSDREIMSFVQQRGVQLPPLRPTSDADATALREGQEAMQRVRGERGATFDRDFLEAMVAGHEQVISEVEQDVAKARDPEIADMLQATLPVLRKHRDRARALLARMVHTNASR